MILHSALMNGVATTLTALHGIRSMETIVVLQSLVRGRKTGNAVRMRGVTRTGVAHPEARRRPVLVGEVDLEVRQQQRRRRYDIDGPEDRGGGPM